MGLHSDQLQHNNNNTNKCIVQRRQYVEELNVREKKFPVKTNNYTSVAEWNKTKSTSPFIVSFVYVWRSFYLYYVCPLKVARAWIGVFAKCWRFLLLSSFCCCFFLLRLVVIWQNRVLATIPILCSTANKTNYRGYALTINYH